VWILLSDTLSKGNQSRTAHCVLPDTWFVNLTSADWHTAEQRNVESGRPAYGRLGRLSSVLFATTSIAMSRQSNNVSCTRRLRLDGVPDSTSDLVNASQFGKKNTSVISELIKKRVEEIRQQQDLNPEPWH